MEFIAHRINTVEALKNLPRKYGVELDLRDSLDGKIYIQHNPFEKGEDFEAYLQCYQHGTMILNIKSERIEYEVLKLIKKYNVKRYFFLDSSFPMIKELSDNGEYNIALRFSEYEGIDTLHNMKGRAKWVWLDCFTQFPIDYKKYQEIRHLGYKICVVSPELQAQPEKIVIYKTLMKQMKIIPEAICTKVYNIEKWMSV